MEKFFAEFVKNDLSIKANPNLNEGIIKERNSNPRRLASSFKQIIEGCKNLGGDQNLELAQKILQLEEENHSKEVKIKQLERQIREKEEMQGQIDNQQSSSIVAEEGWGIISKEESQEAKIVESNLPLRKN